MNSPESLNESALLPCPFCGGSTILFSRSGHDLFHQCVDCGACGPSHLNVDTFRSWNTRHQTTPDSDTVEQVALAIYSHLYINGEEFAAAPPEEDCFGEGWSKQDFLDAAKKAIAAMVRTESPYDHLPHFLSEEHSKRIAKLADDIASEARARRSEISVMEGGWTVPKGQPQEHRFDSGDVSRDDGNPSSPSPDSESSYGSGADPSAAERHTEKPSASPVRAPEQEGDALIHASAPATEQPDDCRAAFEQWVKVNCPDLKLSISDNTRSYDWHGTQCAWVGWQAAFAAVGKITLPARGEDAPEREGAQSKDCSAAFDDWIDGLPEDERGTAVLWDAWKAAWKAKPTERESGPLPVSSKAAYKNICAFVKRWRELPPSDSPDALDVLSDFLLCIGCEWKLEEQSRKSPEAKP